LVAGGHTVAATLPAVLATLTRTELAVRPYAAVRRAHMAALLSTMRPMHAARTMAPAYRI